MNHILQSRGGGGGEAFFPLLLVRNVFLEEPENQAWLRSIHKCAFLSPRRKQLPETTQVDFVGYVLFAKLGLESRPAIELHIPSLLWTSYLR